MNPAGRLPHQGASTSPLHLSCAQCNPILALAPSLPTLCARIAVTPTLCSPGFCPPRVNKPVVQGHGPKGPTFLNPQLQVSLVLSLLQLPLSNRLGLSVWVGKKGYPQTLLQPTLYSLETAWPPHREDTQCLYLPHPHSHLFLRHCSLKTHPCHSHMGHPGLSSYKHSFSHQTMNASLWGIFFFLPTDAQVSHTG